MDTLKKVCDAGEPDFVILNRPPIQGASENSQATIWTARRKSDGAFVAVRSHEIPLDLPSKEILNSARTTPALQSLALLELVAEIEALRHLSRSADAPPDAVMKFFGAHANTEEVLLLHELVVGHIDSVPRDLVDEELVSVASRTCLTALKWMHGRNVVHGAVSPRAIFARAGGTLCLGHVSGGPVSRSSPRYAVAAGPQYYAPSNLQSQDAIPSENAEEALQTADLWCVATTAHTLIKAKFEESDSTILPPKTIILSSTGAAPSRSTSDDPFHEFLRLGWQDGSNVDQLLNTVFITSWKETSRVKPQVITALTSLLQETSRNHA
jgi:hypothetical protein